MKGTLRESSRWLGMLKPSAAISAANSPPPCDRKWMFIRTTVLSS